MNITILGCGRWASFQAWYQSEILKNNVLVWGRKDGCYERISTTHKNDYLTLPNSVKFTNNLGKALKFADYIFIAISAQGMKDFAKDIGACGPKNKTFVLCMKGIIDDTGERLSEVLKKSIDKTNKIIVWVGPGHVQEFTKGQPNIMILDGEDSDAVSQCVKLFKSKLIRLYQGDDLIGAEIGAAAKNVLGIMAGILDGAGLSSLKGALMARGVYEVARLIVAMGGKQLTAYGISHIGDFEATLFSKNSHNRRFGEDLYKKIKNESKDDGAGNLAEGVATSRALKLLAEKYNVEMPICELCYKIVNQGKDPDEGMEELFARDSAKEFRF